MSFSNIPVFPHKTSVDSLDIRAYGAVCDGSTDDSSAINNALADCDARGGGLVTMPAANIVIGSTIDNKYARVTLESTGMSNSRRGDSNNNYGTVLIPTFAGTVLKHRTVYGGNTTLKNWGGGFRNFTVVGNNIATCLLEVDSINGGEYLLSLADCTGNSSNYAVVFKSGVTGTDLADACDVQFSNAYFHITQSYNNANTKDVGAILCNGSNNANYSFNRLRATITFYNGHALELRSADNNEIWLNALKRNAGTGRAVFCRGATADHPVGGDSNNFRWLSARSQANSGSGNNHVYAEGTEANGVTSGVCNSIDYLDDCNATLPPRAGTGSFWTYKYNTAGYQKFASISRGVPYVVNNSTTLVAGIFSPPGTYKDFNYVTWYINEKSDADLTVYLYYPFDWPGREIYFTNHVAKQVLSSGTNIYAPDGSGLTNVILPATAGAWATLVSDGGDNYYVTQYKY